MSEYVKTKRDIETERTDNVENPVCVYLRNRENIQFKPGDILIHQWKTYDEWKTETISEASPKKYLYAFENEVGMGYIRAYNADGKLSEVTVPITEWDLDNNRFILDPDYADHIMIGEGDFNPTELQHERKKHRNRMINKNRKMSAYHKTAAEALAAIKLMNVGETLYKGHSIPDLVAKQYEVVKVDLTTTVANMQHPWQQDQVMKMYNLRKNDPYPQVTVKILKHPYANIGKTEIWDAGHLYQTYIMTKEPYPLTEKI